MMETAKSIYEKFPGKINPDATYAFMCGVSLGINAPKKVLKELLRLLMAHNPEISGKTGRTQ